MFTNIRRRVKLTEEQRRMYASEKLVNFRWIAKILATYSSYNLTSADLVSQELAEELAELGQFAELVYSAVPLEILLANISRLMEEGYPLEGYYALQGATLLSSFQGSYADLPVCILYRRHKKQLVVAISGTSSFKQALQDLRAFKRRHPSGQGSVHTGFWLLYQGIKNLTITNIQEALRTHEVTQLVLTGHSMGGSVAYLLCMDLLSGQLPKGLSLMIAVFGTPRTGNLKLVTHWLDLTASYKRKNGSGSLKEHSIKAYNDGVPALPPTKLGYRHFAQEPLYTVSGKLYRVPLGHSEHALFHISPDNENDEVRLAYPRGGHNYYNGRDLEKFSRRIAWLDSANYDKEGWEERYKLLVK